MSEHPCIRIWHWNNAPEEYTKLSQHGGDEDWVLFCPKALLGWGNPVALWPVLDSDEDSYLSGFGHVDRHELDSGDLVVIFAHA